MKPLYSLHNPGQPITLNLAGLDMQAFSISGLATYVMVPAFSACFDLGHCPAEAIGLRNIFLSHVHQDHANGAIRHLALRRMTSQSPSKIYLPAESANDFIRVLEAFDQLEKREPKEDYSRIIYGVNAGDEISLGRHKVIAFDVKHRIASRGYTVIESRKKLKPQYQNLSGLEIGQAVMRGEEINDYIQVARFTYIGDSIKSTLLDHPEVGQSEILFLEATHLGAGHLEVSQRYGHTHLDELVQLWNQSAPALQAANIVLKHFSMRYYADEIKAAIAALPEDLKMKLTILI